MRQTLVPELRDPEARRGLSEAMAEVFELWALEDVVQAALLGLADTKVLRQGQPLPDDAAVLERVGHLLAIHRALATIFDEDLEAEGRWIVTPDNRLDGRSPLNMMLTRGIDGIRAVRAFVDTLLEAAEGRLS